MFLINDKDNFSESILLSEYVSSFIDDSLDQYEETTINHYSLEDLETWINNILIQDIKCKEFFLNNGYREEDICFYKSTSEDMIDGKFNRNCFYNDKDLFENDEFLKRYHVQLDLIKKNWFIFIHFIYDLHTLNYTLFFY